ncbi:MAG: hypothetical protein Q8O37_16375 [Sulfuricellaceae bacterium]|nr:hypothetical protein [Sulfuricellaceae bacterium]
MSSPLTATERTRAMGLLRAEVERTDIAKTARHIGYSRATTSLVFNGEYKASSVHVLTKVLATLDRIACPYLGAEVEASYCQDTNTGPTPTWDPSALAQRRMCQTCVNKPSAVSTQPSAKPVLLKADKLNANKGETS